MRWKYVKKLWRRKVYAENININLNNFEKTEKEQIIDKNRNKK